MLTTAEATSAILNSMTEFGAVTANLGDATGRVLRQSVHAERDQPPFDRVTMDGIAIQYASFKAGNRRFSIQGRQHAGDPQTILADPSSCIEIMTGAVLPENTDTVIPVERILVSDDFADLEPDTTAAERQFVHFRGSDHRQNHKILDAGHVIEPVDIAVIASCGLNQVSVSRRPVIRTISTGNELVAAGRPIQDHQIRLSNGPAIVAMLQSSGYPHCEHDHLADDRELLESRLRMHLEESDVLILSGGVSMGKADFVPEVLTNLGVRVVFHKISQRPGKPMWFGVGPKNQAVFALPGNPVSALVCCRHYVLPALASASGRGGPATEHAALTEPFSFSAPLTCFLPVKLRTDGDGQMLATPVPTNTSGDFSALSGTDGYLELARQQDEFAAGSSWPLHRWKV